jgi:hypothetical protein
VSRRRRRRTDLPEFTGYLNAAHIGEEPNPSCIGHEDEFVDYEIEDLPTKEDAELMCERCPIGELMPVKPEYAGLCKRNARHVRPYWGVQGGIVWVEGRQAHLFKPDDPRLSPAYWGSEDEPQEPPSK